MNYKLLLILLLVAVGLAGVFYLYPTMSTTPNEPVTCTKEAKLCSDGSSVGRTGPNCEFSECPTSQVPVVKESSTAALNEKILTNGVFITPLEVLSDSRCPSDVVCVWAGEVTLKVILGKGSVSKEVVLKLQDSSTFENNNISLTGVAPEKNSTAPFNNQDYRFTFLVTPFTAGATGTVTGTVTTSPTCPVERIPQEPQCAPRPYTTSVHVREEGKQAIVQTVQSDAKGVFTASLPAGSYELEAITADNSSLPRCTKVIVLVKSGQNTVADISCDTGIR